MRSFPKSAGLVWALLAPLAAETALAQDQPPPSAPPAAPPEAPAEPPQPEPAPNQAPAAPQTEAPTQFTPDEAPAPGPKPAPPAPAPPKVVPTGPPKGYIPGSRRSIGLGLSPYAPIGPALPGGATEPLGAPEADDSEFQFNFGGYMSAALRLSTGGRDRATPEQFHTTLHAPPRTPDIYGAVQGTNAPQGSWVELRFDYGNQIVKAVVKLSTWKPTSGQTWIETSSQNWVNEAFIVYTMPQTGDLSLNWTVGAFRNSYGTLGQYSAGQYNAAIIGSPFGIGETLSAKYALSDSFALIAEHGVMGRLGKVPVGAGPNVYDHAPSAARPSSFVHHAHAGFAITDEVPFQFGLHYLSNFAQDERDQVDDPKTQLIDESLNRPDPKMDVYGVDFRMIHNYLGNFAVAASYADASYADLLTGFNYYGADTGELLTKRLIGPQGGGTGKLLVTGAEYNFSWSKFLYHPEAFWGDGPDLITSVFANFVAVLESRDPNFDGRKIYKLGTEITYRPLSWFAISGRYDHVAPNSKDHEESFDVISPKLIFRSDWNSHEQVTLSYTRWFYGDHTRGEAPNDYTHEELDDQMFGLSFGMWW